MSESLPAVLETPVESIQAKADASAVSATPVGQNTGSDPDFGTLLAEARGYPNAAAAQLLNGTGKIRANADDPDQSAGGGNPLPRSPPLGAELGALAEADTDLSAVALVVEGPLAPSQTASANQSVPLANTSSARSDAGQPVLPLLPSVDVSGDRSVLNTRPAPLSAWRLNAAAFAEAPAPVSSPLTGPGELPADRGERLTALPAAFDVFAPRSMGHDAVGGRSLETVWPGAVMNTAGEAARAPAAPGGLTNMFGEPVNHALTELTAPVSNAGGISARLPMGPVNFNGHQFGPDLDQQVIWLARQNIQTARIRMNPPHLGPIEVRISVNSADASVQFLSAHAGVREALEIAVVRLRESLADVGLSLSHANVSDYSRGSRDGAGESAPRGYGWAPEQPEQRSADAVVDAISESGMQGLLSVYA